VSNACDSRQIDLGVRGVDIAGHHHALPTRDVASHDLQEAPVERQLERHT